MNLENAIVEFKEKFAAATGKEAPAEAVRHFTKRVKTEVAEAQLYEDVLEIQIGLMPEETISGRAETVSVAINTKFV